MKLTLKRSAKLFAMVIATSLLVFSCNKKEKTPPTPPTPTVVKVKEIKLSETSLGLVADDTKTITATVTPENAKDKTLTWATDNKEIATVDNTGKVKAVKVGECKITATANDGSNVKAECKVIVTAKIVDVTEVTLDKETLELTEGDDPVTLTATVLPEEATNKEVEWTTENPAIATVENGAVRAIAPGETKITVKTVDGGKTAECTVKVSKKIYLVEKVELDKTSVTLKLGHETDSKVTLTATITPDNADNKNVTWKSSNEKVATVDAEGNVTAVAEGNATITVVTEDGEKTAECAVTVVIPVTGVAIKDITEGKDTTAFIGKPLTLEAVITPDNATNKNVTWESSNDLVATVENGVVKGLQNGQVTVTVTTEDGSFTATVNVNIRKEIFFKDMPDYVPASKVAETNAVYNTTSYAFTLANDNTTKSSSYVKEVYAASYSTRTITIDGTNYHIPSIAEMRAILPTNEKVFQFTTDVDGGMTTETIKVSKDKAEESFSAQYKVVAALKVCYAIKMMGGANNDAYRTAYRYEWKNDDTDNAHLEIKVKYLGAEGKNQTIEDVAIEDFWQKVNKTIVLPACGNTPTMYNVASDYSSSVVGNGTQCNYWLGDYKGGTNVFNPPTMITCINVDKTKGSLFENNSLAPGRTIRLFKD